MIPQSMQTSKLTLGEDWTENTITGEGEGGPKYGDLGIYYKGKCILPLGIDHYETHLDGEPKKLYRILKKAIDDINQYLP